MKKGTFYRGRHSADRGRDYQQYADYAFISLRKSSPSACEP